MTVKLIMFKRNGQRKEFTLRKTTSVIGRGEDCTLRIPLANVSRRHCELVKGDAAVTVRDLASSNGTYVNNRRVNEAALNAGDRLVVGPVVFTVQINGQPQEIRPVAAPVPAGAAEEEEVIELEADVTGTEESDPIAALEALAAKNKPKKK